VTAARALAFLAFAVAAAGTPGPSNVLLAAVGARVGVRRGLPALVGVALGMATLMFAVAFGLGRLIVASPLALAAVRWSGAAVLGWLAWRIATAPRMPAARPGPPVGLVGAAAFQWLNPKAWLVCAAAAATFLDAAGGSPAAQSGALAGLFFAAAMPSGLPWLAVGALMQRWLRSERAFRAFSVAMALLLAGSVVALLR
jgi:threonine/homoserine/homoserine lactone efflux protein